MNENIFQENGQTIAQLGDNFVASYYDAIGQLAHDLKQSQGGYDPQSLEIVMEIDPKNKPAGWDEFVDDMMKLAD